jgi:hypothetical protein
MMSPPRKEENREEESRGEERPYFLYLLFEPRPYDDYAGRARYVGITYDPKRREYEHTHPKWQPLPESVLRWELELKKVRYTVVFKVIEGPYTEKLAKFRESQWILYLKVRGNNPLNTRGGRRKRETEDDEWFGDEVVEGSE